ncbi:Dihydrolipoamide dehydrogenase [hydrothermal vent metagenome]|uniref:Dihydrolipoamide dehydrogenase n=1 Tax=hydrothermal vent metagenome TaxID=652676 RepID=A0A3B1C166_9ZZZZ
MSRYDLAIIGAGPGGYAAALRASSHGLTVALIEKGEVGGVCLNRGCVPAKSWIASAETIDIARHMASIALEPFDYKIDFAKVAHKQQSIVTQFRKSLRGLLKKKGVEIIDGEGKFISDNAIEVTHDDSMSVIDFNIAIIATGSKPSSLFDLDKSLALDSDSIFELTTLPSSLIIVGGGAIGCEFAGALSRFGVDITIIEMEPRILPMEDKEISATLSREFKKNKIKICAGARIESLEPYKAGVRATLNNGDQIVAEKALVSVGRSFNTNGLGLEKAGVEVGEGGEVITDDNLRASTPNIFAVGDVAGKHMLAYTAYREGEIVADYMAGKGGKVSEYVIPNTIFTIPEIGSVGLSEEKAPENAKVGSFMFRSLARAHATGEIAGFVKLIADANTDRLLGAHIIGPRATDLIHIASVAISRKMTAEAFGEIVFAHPTFAEAILEAAHDIHGRSLHK